MKKFTKVIIWIILVIIIIGVGIQLSFVYYFNKKIVSDLKTEIYKQSKGEYVLTVGSLTTNIFNQSIYVSDVKLEPLMSVNPTSPKYFAKAKNINFISFSLIKFLTKKHLEINKMELTEPVIEIYRGNGKKEIDKINEKTGEKFSIYNMIKRHIKDLTISEIKIVNADMKVYDNLNSTKPVISSNDNRLDILNLHINSNVEKAGRLFIADTVNLSINKFLYVTADSLYSISVKKLSTSYTDSTLTLDSVKLIPNFNKKEFRNQVGKQTDRFDMTAKKAEFSKMNVKLFFERNWFVAENLTLEGLNISAYRNKNDYREEKKVKTVQELVSSIKIYTDLKKITLKNATMAYEEVVEGNASGGKVTFENLNAVISNFSNDEIFAKSGGTLTVNGYCNFMGKSKLKVNYSFPLAGNNFHCSGVLSNMSMDIMNPMIEPVASAIFKSGHVDSMVFSFNAGEKIATGKMRFAYHDLQVEILNKKTNKSGLFTKVISFLAHKLVIKESNPEKGKPLRETEIKCLNNQNRFIFNYTWRSILSGIKPAIGLPDTKKKK